MRKVISYVQTFRVRNVRRQDSQYDSPLASDYTLRTVKYVLFILLGECNTSECNRNSEDALGSYLDLAREGKLPLGPLALSHRSINVIIFISSTIVTFLSGRWYFRVDMCGTPNKVVLIVSRLEFSTQLCHVSLLRYISYLSKFKALCT